MMNFKPKSSFSQNFLIDPEDEIKNKMFKAGQITKSDCVLEIGPGLGVLTKPLANIAKNVISVELDKKLYNYLQTALASCKNLTLINGDILALLNNYSDLIKSLPIEYKIVSSLPYNITSIFLRRCLELEKQPKVVILIIQKEVALRILAKPGEMSVLAIAVQYYAEPELIDFISKTYFDPKPKVDSAIIKLVPHGLARDSVYEAKFFRLVRCGFSARRKQLKNNLMNGFRISDAIAQKILMDCKLDPACRAQDLSLDDWKNVLGQLESRRSFVIPAQAGI